MATYDVYLAELALWERRWTDADEAVRDGLARARSRDDGPAPRLALRQGAARTGGAGGARPRPPGRRRRPRPGSPGRGSCIATARRAAAEASAVTPNAAGWLALAEAEYQRAHGVARPESVAGRRGQPGSGSSARRSPPTAAGARPRRSSPPAPPAPRRARRSGRRTPSRPGSAQSPWLRQLELLAQRARLELAPPDAGSPDRKQGLEEILGLTPREAEVLTLLARGYTNREIAAALVISVRTAGVHVSHILRKLGAPNRLEAAAIAHRLSPPHVGRPQFEA